MAIDLKKLEAKFDAVLENETEESFNEWLKNKRNNMEQTAVRRLIDYITERGFDLEYEMEMSFLDHEKEQIEESFIMGSQWSIFPDDTPINEIAEKYYHETYGK